MDTTMIKRVVGVAAAHPLTTVLDMICIPAQLMAQAIESTKGATTVTDELTDITHVASFPDSDVKIGRICNAKTLLNLTGMMPCTPGIAISDVTGCGDYTHCIITNDKFHTLSESCKLAFTYHEIGHVMTGQIGATDVAGILQQEYVADMFAAAAVGVDKMISALEEIRSSLSRQGFLLASVELNDRIKALS